MNKEKAIKWVIEKLGISSFEGLSTSYSQIRQNGTVVLNKNLSNEPMYFKIKSIIENIWLIEKTEKEIDALMN